MNNNTHILCVYNTCTGTSEMVEVTTEVFNAYRRTQWNADKNDSKHSENTTPFSQLRGGDDGAYENFDEFISEADNPEKIVLESLWKHSLRLSLKKLEEHDYHLIIELFVNGKTEREIAEVYSVSQSTINKRKKRILKILKNILEN